MLDSTSPILFAHKFFINLNTYHMNTTFIPSVTALGNCGKLVHNPYYSKAKHGCIESAVKLVSFLFTKANQQKIRQMICDIPNVLIAPVYGIEASGINKIPVAFANAIAQVCDTIIDTDIYLENKPKHTNATAINRFLSLPIFSGFVVIDANYVLVDDVSTSGASLKAMKDYIESKGGNVIACIVLGLGRQGSQFEPTQKDLYDLICQLDIHELNSLLNETGRTNIHSLTAIEIRFLKQFSSVNELRKKLTNH
jgi:adenine/guanine phosphoribosyltransferase-like PRPP-binding protein